MVNDVDAYSFLLGWMLLRPQPLEGFNPDVPQPLLSASNCLCEVRPDYNDWYEKDRLDFLREYECNTQGNSTCPII